VNSEGVDHFRTARVLLETKPPEMHINIDGEIDATTPEEFRVVRNALRVIVPKASTAARMDE
jgi:diacylglycerol kinase (ATP)